MSGRTGRALALGARVALGGLSALGGLGAPGAIVSGCGPGAGATSPNGGPKAVAMLPDVRIAKDRPPVVLVVREGDPSGAVAVAVSTSGVDDVEEDPEPAVALAGVVEARLAARGLFASVTPSWSGFRAALLVATPEAAAPAADALRETLAAPIDDRDLAAARKKLAALAARPLKDASLARWARCVGSPHALTQRAGKSGDHLVAARLEKWRAGAHGLGRVALAVAAPSQGASAVADAIARGPAWKAGAPPPAVTTARGSGGAQTAGAQAAAAHAGAASGSAIDVDVYEATSELSGAVVVHATLDVGTGSDAVTTADALGDPHGPLASRLAALDVPFRMREVTGTADPRGGCVAIVLGASSAATGAAPAGSDLAARVADAAALVHVEAQVHLAEGGAGLDGRTLARRAGDAREAAERAAWWQLADTWLPKAAAASTASVTSAGALPMRGSVTLGVPLRRASTPAADGLVEPSRDALASAMQRAALSWQKPVAEGRARVEPGQGETWVLLASPCGTEGETEADAGLTALFTFAAAEIARSAPESRVEPWIVPDGAGLLVHGPALSGESASAQARRLADIVARSFAADPIPLATISRARAELLRHDVRTGGRTLSALASAIAPGHPSWILAGGREETLAGSADAAVLARAQALRAGPLRLAVLANVDAAQGDAALRAADRWIDRRAGDARTCKSKATAVSPRPGTYAVEPRADSTPEADLAFPFPAGDERARAAAALVASALDGDGGMLDKALGSSSTGAPATAGAPATGGAAATGGAPPALAKTSSARVVGWPRSPALVVRIVATQAQLDAAVMQARALVDRIKNGGLAPADHERAVAALSREAIAAALDPRARIVATWRGEAIPTASDPLPRGKATVDEVRAFAAKYLGEHAMVVVTARPARVKAAPAP